MAYTVPEVEPSKVTAGDTIDWKKYLADFLPGDYTLKYSFRGPKNFDLTSTADGTSHLIEVTAAVSATWSRGTYYWQSYVEAGSEKRTINRGQLVVLPNLTAITAPGHDGRSQAKQILEAVRAAILKKASRIQEEYEVDGMRVKDMDPAKLIEIEDRYARIVDAEEKQENIDVGRPGRKKILHRFTKP